MCARWSGGWRLFAGVLSEQLRGEGPALLGSGRPRDPRGDPQQGLSGWGSPGSRLSWGRVRSPTALPGRAPIPVRGRGARHRPSQCAVRVLGVYTAPRGLGAWGLGGGRGPTQGGAGAEVAKAPNRQPKAVGPGSPTAPRPRVLNGLSGRSQVLARLRVFRRLPGRAGLMPSSAPGGHLRPLVPGLMMRRAVPRVTCPPLTLPVVTPSHGSSLWGHYLR